MAPRPRTHANGELTVHLPELPTELSTGCQITRRLERVLSGDLFKNIRSSHYPTQARRGPEVQELKAANKAQAAEPNLHFCARIVKAVFFVLSSTTPT